ncbi:hypothetical protein EDC96DRAFT_530843, partial [Choanephora cucurbitarum]
IVKQSMHMLIQFRYNQSIAQFRCTYFFFAFIFYLVSPPTFHDSSCPMAHALFMLDGCVVCVCSTHITRYSCFDFDTRYSTSVFSIKRIPSDLSTHPILPHRHDPYFY